MDNDSYVVELEEKIKVYRDELNKRDELIQKLSSMDINLVKIEEKSTEEDQQTRAKREELANLRSKVDQLCDKTLFQESELKAKSSLLTKYEQENEKLKCKLNETINENKQLKQKVNSMEEEIQQKVVENQLQIKIVGELSESLRKEKKNLEEINKRLNLQVQDKEQKEYETQKAEERLEYFVTQMIKIYEKYLQNEQLNPTKWKDDSQIRNLLNKTTELIEENIQNKGHIQNLTDKIKQKDQEISERNRTVDRLGEQLTRSTVSDKETVNLNQELEYCRGNEKALETRVRTLSNELIDAQVRIRELEKQLSQSLSERDSFNHIRNQHYHNHIEEEYSLFNPTELAIKEHTRRLVAELKEQKEIISSLEARLSEAVIRLDDTKSYKHEIEHTLDRTERECLDLREQLKRAQTELVNSNLIKQEQRSEKQKIFFYLCKLAGKVKIDENVASHMQFDELQEVLLTRINQIVTGEYALLSDVQANADRVNGLNRKIKRLQDQLASREIQLGLWKEKSAKLENELLNKTQVETQAQSNKLSAEKANAQCRKAELEAARLKEEINRLKAEMLDFSDSKIKAVEIEEKWREMMKLNEELEVVRQNQANKIVELSKNLEDQMNEQTLCRLRTDDEFKQLTDDLQTCRKTVEQLRRSEKELLEFRALIARLLGLDVNSLVVPNYDIVNRLENFVAHHHIHLTDSTNSPEQHIRNSHSPYRQYPNRNGDISSSRSLGDYVAIPNKAKARSKQAWVNLNETHLNKDDKNSNSFESFKCDPRKY